MYVSWKYCLAITVLFKIGSISSVEDIHSPQDGSVTLHCNHNEVGVNVIAWVLGLDSSHTYVASWIDGYDPSYYGQWGGRTNMATPVGDLTFNNLGLNDEGRYVCKYDTNGVAPGTQYGERYFLEVTG